MEKGECMGDFVHLHLHSEYSLLDGACRIRDIPAKAKEMGHTAVAITDHGAMYGVVSFYKACMEEGIKPIIGCEAYVAKRTMADKERAYDAKSYHLVLLVKNEIGYQNLIYLVSKAFTEGFYSKPRIDLDLLEKHHEGLIALSACLAGYIPQAILAGEYDNAEKHALSMEKLFGKGNYYLEVQHHGLNDDAVVCEGIRNLSHKTGIPMVATNDVHYLDKKDADHQAILMCVQTNTVITDGKPIGFETDEFYYKSTAEMEALFADYEDAITNTVKIADMCDYNFRFGETKLPRFRPENGMEPMVYLRSLAEAGLEEKIRSGNVIPDETYTKEVYEQRIEYELSVIGQMGYAEYYLIVWDFVHHAKETGIPVGPGRGSGAGSLVAYLIGITDIDSIRFNLLFERFLNPERVSMPDFDIDFCYDRRDEAIAYVREKYGTDHTAQIITFGTLAARAAVRDVGRALGMSVSEVDVVAKKIPQEMGITLQKARSNNRELQELYENDEKIRRLLDTSEALEGMPRHASTHAAGVVITELPITSYVPVAVNGNTIVTQFDMDTIAELGLLKFDFLALRYLTIIENAVRQIKENDPNFDLSKVDIEDAATYDTICAGKTDGVFQLESDGMRQMLMQLCPKGLNDIIAAIALYRPGPMDSIPKYIEARHNPDHIEYCTPKLAPILDVTYGCIVYQEQVMQIFREIAGYSFGHADVVRRAISKKKQGVLEKEKEAFLNGAQRNGVNLADAEALFDDIVSFANYAFNKSHAAAYGVISFRTAYLKTHYPKEYTSALLSSVLSSTGKLTEYITDCIKRGIPVLPPDINKSHADFHVEGNNIRFGLLAVKSVGLPSITSVIAEREAGGPFTDFADFIDRMNKMDIHKRQLEALIKSGAFDSLGTKRSQLLAVYETLLDKRSSVQKKDLGQIGMFDAGIPMDIPQAPAIEYPNIPEFTAREKLSLEKESCGFYLSGHILDDYTNHLSEISADSVAEIMAAFTEDEQGSDRYFDKTNVIIAGAVTKRVNKAAKNGDPMAFVTIEDRSGEIEVVCFPKKLAHYSHLLSYDSVVCIKGTLSARGGDEEIKVLLNQAIQILDNANYTSSRNEPDKTETEVPMPPVPPQEDIPPAAEEMNYTFRQTSRVYLRVANKECEAYRRSKALLTIFPGNVSVIYYYRDTGEYDKTEILRTSATPLVIEELQEICGPENVVQK
ncbi:MAG: DNA polymerase III subunit alpha [Clostridia bacterium]|nr:DNA polymerase III subunit alpha [Clostridia bacterium]